MTLFNFGWNVLSLLIYRYEFCCHFTGDAGKVWSVCSIRNRVPGYCSALPHCTEEHSSRSLLNGIQSRHHISTIFHLLGSVNSSLYKLSNLQTSAWSSSSSKEEFWIWKRKNHSITFTEASFGEFSSTSYLYLNSFQGFILYQGWTGYRERRDLFWSICGPT